MHRRIFITLCTCIMLLIVTGLAAAQQSGTPAVTAFSSSLKTVDRTALTNRTARIPVTWTTVNRPILSNLVFEQVMPDNSIINVELPRLVPWVMSSGSGIAAPILPTASSTQIRLRVRLVNLITQATMDSKEITLLISQDGSGSTPGSNTAPTITSFSTSLTGPVKRSDLTSGTARIPVAWTSINRPLSATLVFDQIMADGSLVNVELPRSTPWVNSSDKGMVAPRLTAGTPTEIRLRVRLVDLVFGRVLDQRELALPIDAGMSQTPDISLFTTAVTNLKLDELRNKALVPVAWQVNNRPDNTNLVFEQVLANNQVRNAELPRDFTIVPSWGQGNVVLIDPGSATEVVFRVRLVDLGTGSTLATREIKLPVLSTSDGDNIVTGDACYKAPFPASTGLKIGQPGRVLSFSNNATLSLNKDKAPNYDSMGYLNSNDAFTVMDGPYCVIHGNQAPLWNLRQWKVQTSVGNKIGWVDEYSGNPQDGFVTYITGNITQTDTVPEIVTFAVQPADKLDFKGTVTVTWELRNTNRVMVNIGKTTLIDQAAKGSATFNVKDVYNYNPLTVSITGYGAQQNYIDKTVTLPVDTPGLAINSFTVSPDSVQQGAPVTVTWEIAGTFASAYVNYDKFDSQFGVSELNVTSNSGQGTITIGDGVHDRVHTFTLWVVDANGVTLSKDVQVTVTCASTSFFVSDPANQDGRCASPQSSVQAAYQPFSGGFMLWKKEPSGYNTIMAFYNSGTFAFYPDWDGSAYQITDTTPNVLLPANGFGFVWNANPEVKSGLGYPTAGEQGYNAAFQSTLRYGKYDPTFYYVTLPDGRIIRYTTGVGNGSPWSFVK